MATEEHRAKVVASNLIFGKKRLLPSAREHESRNNFNMVPSNTTHLYYVTSVQHTKRGPLRRLFRDSETKVLWERQPWYLNMLHAPWKNHKFLAFDAEVVKDADGSSELIVPKKSKVISADDLITYSCEEMGRASYNFKTKGMKHFVADILPVLIYCNRV